MIPTAYTVGNFKAIGAPQTIQLRPVSLIFGKNSAGKSSIIQSLLLCQHAVQKGNFDLRAAHRWGQVIDLGGFRQYIHKHSAASNLTVEFTLSRSQSELNSSALDSQVQRLVRPLVDEGSEPHWSFNYFNFTEELSVRFEIGLLPEREDHPADLIPQVKGIVLSTGASPLISCTRDSRGRMVVNALTFDHEDATLAFARLAAELLEYPESSSEESDRTLSAVVDELAIDRLNTPKDLLATVERTYHDAIERKRISKSERTFATAEMRKEHEKEFRKFLDILGQSEHLAAIIHVVTEELLQEIRRIVLDGQGLLFGQKRENRLESHRFQIEEEIASDASEHAGRTMVEVEAIEGPLNFFLNDPKGCEPIRALAKAIRFDLELMIEAVFDNLRFWLGSIEYYGAYRSIPPRFDYLESGSGTAGEALHASLVKLLNDPQLLADVSDVLQETLSAPYRLELRKLAPRVDYAQLREQLERVAETHRGRDPRGLREAISDVLEEMLKGKEALGLHLIDVRNQTEVDFCDVGFGIGQVLPLLVEIATERQGLVCIEQPEIHLHPKMQSDLADVFIRETNQNSGLPRKRFVLETHSEHLILRLLRRVRKTTEMLAENPQAVTVGAHSIVSPDDIAVHWVEMEDGSAIVTTIGVTPDGDFDRDWPEGFFDERFKEMP